MIRRQTGKRLFDAASASLLLAVLSPLLASVALLILVTTGPPVIFRQRRPGLRGKAFMILKFRTMAGHDRGGSGASDSERLTPLGRALRQASLDELPELINVVKGDMSLVGPRPLLTEYLGLYSAAQARRHEVRPGITGWAQVNGRNAITWEQKFSCDIWYMDNWSFMLDLKILWMTLVRVIGREGISQPGHATMEKFRGPGGAL